MRGRAGREGRADTASVEGAEDSRGQGGLAGWGSGVRAGGCAAAVPLQAAAPQEGRTMGARPLGGGEREESPGEAEAAAPPPRLPPASPLQRREHGGTRGLQ